MGLSALAVVIVGLVLCVPLSDENWFACMLVGVCDIGVWYAGVVGDENVGVRAAVAVWCELFDLLDAANNVVDCMGAYALVEALDWVILDVPP